MRMEAKCKWKWKWGSLLGAGLAVSLALAAAPAEVRAAGPCNDKNSCVGYTDPDTVHNHAVDLKSDTIVGGHFTGQVRANRTCKIQNGTFDQQVEGGMNQKVDVLFIQDGNFQSLVVYSEATIYGGTFRGIVYTPSYNNGINGQLDIQGGTFYGSVQIRSGSSISGGIFRGVVDVNDAGQITGGTFLGGIRNVVSNEKIDLSALPGVTVHTVTLQHADGTTQTQTVVGDNGCACKPNDSRWVDEQGADYDFGRTVSTDLTLKEISAVSAGGESEEGMTASSSSGKLSGAASAGRKHKGDDGITGEPVCRIPVHTCQYEWVTVQEAGAAADGEKRLMCKLCGSVETVEILSASDYRYAQLYDAVSLAGEKETVTYDLGNFYTISDRLLTALQNRRDVTLVLTYTCQGRQYETTFPAGADYTELLEDQDSFYGLLGLCGRCQILMKDVSEEADAGTETDAE